MKAQVQSLKEMYGKPNCWESQSRLWSGFGPVMASPSLRSWERGTCPTRRASLSTSVWVRSSFFGPKAFGFCDDFSNHRATNLKPDGMEILSVEIDLNRPDPA